MAELINNYGDIGALTILVGLMVWYLKYQTKQQTKRETKHDKIQEEERLFYRKVITNDLKGLHDDSVKNADLNNKSIAMLKDISNNQSKLCKLIESLNRRINGKGK